MSITTSTKIYSNNNINSNNVKIIIHLVQLLQQVLPRVDWVFASVSCQLRWAVLDLFSTICVLLLLYWYCRCFMWLWRCAGCCCCAPLQDVSLISTILILHCGNLVYATAIVCAASVTLHVVSCCNTTSYNTVCWSLNERWVLWYSVLADSHFCGT